MPKRTTPREIARFLTALSTTGNFALAAAAIGRGKAGLYKRRANDPSFALQCDAAIVLARARLSRCARPLPRPGALLTSGGELHLSTARNRVPQLRRAIPGRLTPAGLDTFLLAVSTTANIRLSAASVGVAPSSIHARRRRDSEFRRVLDEALQLGCHRLELALIERAGAFLDPCTADPLAPWAEADPDPLPDAPLPPEPVVEAMTVDDALRLLGHHRRQTRRQQHPPRRVTMEELMPAMKRKVDAIIRKRSLPRTG